MILNKEEFENGLRQDMQSHPRANQIFGPQVNLTGEKQQVNNNPNQNQQKTKRELLWEQKMLERKGVTQQQPIQSQQPAQVQQPVNQFQKATQFEQPQVLQMIQVPQETPPQLERPKAQAIDPVAIPPPSYMIQRQEFMKGQKNLVRKDSQADVLDVDQWSQPNPDLQFNPEQIQPRIEIMNQNNFQQPNRIQTNQNNRYQPVASSVESLQPQSIQNQLPTENFVQPLQFQRPIQIQPQQLNVGAQLRVQDNQPAAPSSFPNPNYQFQTQIPLQNQRINNRQEYQHSVPINQADRMQQLEQPYVLTPSLNEEQFQFQPVQLGLQNQNFTQLQPQIQHNRPLIYEQLASANHLMANQIQHQNQFEQQISNNYQYNQQWNHNNPNQNQNQQQNVRSTTPQDGLKIGSYEDNKKKQFQNEYLADWANQIKLKEEKRRQEKMMQKQLDLEKMKEAEEYNPFGRAGAGAPNKDIYYQPLARPLQQQQQQQYMDQIGQVDSYQGVPPQLVGSGNNNQQQVRVQDESKLIGFQDPKTIQAIQEAKKKQLSQNLLQQMEEVKLRKEEETKRKKQEEAQEEQRLQKEREELEAKYRLEEQSKNKTKQQVMEENAKLMEEKRKRQEQPSEVVSQSVRSKRLINLEDQKNNENSYPQIQLPVAQNDQFLNMPHNYSQEWQNQNHLPNDFQQQQTPQNQPPQIDHTRIVNEISEQLKNNFNGELGRLKQQMEFQQQAFERQLLQLRNESQQLAENKETAEQELARLRLELLEQRERERAIHHNNLAHQQFAQHEFMYGSNILQPALNNSLVRTSSAKSELGINRPVSSQSQQNARVESRNSSRKLTLANLEKNLLQPQITAKVQNKLVHPKDVQIVTFDVPFSQKEVDQYANYEQNKSQIQKSQKPPLVPVGSGTGRSRDTTLDFFTKLEPKPLPENYAQPVLGDISFDFPTLPPYQGIQKQLINQQNNQDQPKVQTSQFMKMKNPNETSKTDVSQTSINLEVLNQRNQTRLARLENVGNLEGSSFKLDASRIVSSPYKLPNESTHQDYLIEEDPLSRIMKQANEQDIQPRWGQDKPESRGKQMKHSELDCSGSSRVEDLSAPSSESLPTNFDQDFECRIEVQGAVEQVLINGQKQECLNVQVQLQEGVIDEQHDLLYLLQRGEKCTTQETSMVHRGQMPQTYKDLDINYVIKLTKAGDSIGHGVIVISNLPPGKYKIYYLKPCEPQRILKSANVKLRKVGRGQEFNIWYVSKHSSQLNNCQSLDDSIPISITSDQVRAANSQLSMIDTVRLMHFQNDGEQTIDQQDSQNDTPRVIEVMSDSETAEVPEGKSIDPSDTKPIHSDLLKNRSTELCVQNNFSNQRAFDQRMEACMQLLKSSNPLHSKLTQTQITSQKKPQNHQTSKNNYLISNSGNHNSFTSQELSRKENLQSLRTQLQKDFKEQQLKLSQSYELMKSTRNNRLGRILQSNQNFLSTVEEIESSNLSQTTLLRDACATFKGNTSSKSKLRNSSLIQLASNQKYSGSQICEDMQITANSISGELMQLMCQETIPVDEESDSEEVEEIFLRVPQIDYKINNYVSSSEETTQTNSHLGSLLVPQTSNSNIQLSIEQSDSSTLNKKSQACKPFKENNEKKQVQRQRIARKQDNHLVRKKTAQNIVKKIR